GRLPAAKVARAVYVGPYEGLGAAWGELRAWVESNGHTCAKNLWECYVVGPESQPDANAYRTELNQPLL
ncbi:MAG: GyrI-like domain-containing protein, partial [Polyangiales bacterium]